MGADSPHSKNIVLRAARTIMFMSQIGGRDPPSGQNEKWTKVQNFEPVFLKNSTLEFSQIFCVERAYESPIDVQILRIV